MNNKIDIKNTEGKKLNLDLNKITNEKMKMLYFFDKYIVIDKKEKQV